MFEGLSKGASTVPRGVKGEGKDAFAGEESGVKSSSNGSQACYVSKHDILGVLENFPK